MDIWDFFSNTPWRVEIEDLRAETNARRVSTATTMGRQAKLIGLLEQEQKELRLRLGVLIRLLVRQGSITAEQFSLALLEAKTNLERAAVAPAPNPTVVRLPVPRRLPKPPKLNPPPPKP